MSNLYTRFRKLLPSSPLQVAEVKAVNADGTSNVEYPQGDVVRVRGDSVSVGQNAYIRDGQIEGEAPTLTFYQETV